MKGEGRQRQRRRQGDRAEWAPGPGPGELFLGFWRGFFELALAIPESGMEREPTYSAANALGRDM